MTSSLAAPYNLDWPQLANSCTDRPCIIVGKGPSFEEWASLGLPHRPDTIFIGINHAANALPYPCFGVSTDDIDAILGTRFKHVRWVRGIPYRPFENGEAHTEKTKSALSTGDLWFHHTEECEPGIWRKSQTPQQIAQTFALYCHGSSAHPAIHLAKYLGCARPTFIGLDGGGGYAKTFADNSLVAPNDTHYPEMRRVSLALRDEFWPQ
jgi:hypothetical protein